MYEEKEKLDLNEIILEYISDPIGSVIDFVDYIKPETKEAKIAWIFISIATMGMPIVIVGMLIFCMIVFYPAFLVMFFLFYPIIKFTLDLFNFKDSK